MPKIVQLSADVVNKIAAGEVIERPASVVKELIENAVDAGATRVDVAIEKGGSQLMRVSDNGCGIEADQLSLAVQSHATSKLRTADDLFRVESLGFRGEALASIASVSRMTIRSRRADQPQGAKLEVVGGKEAPIQPCGCPTGTTVEIENLFYNTPVRRKFLRTTQTEMGHASEAFTRIALAHPGIHFTLRHNGRSLHDLPPEPVHRARIARLFGDELAGSLIPIHSEEGSIQIEGFVADPSQSRANNRMQYLILNGRHIRDRSLQHALSEAYRGLLLTGRFPIAILNLSMPADAVDVNVHPSKLEVRFQDGGRLYSQLLGALRTKFLSTDLTARGDASASAAGNTSQTVPMASQHETELVNWAKGQLSAKSGAVRESDLEPGTQHSQQPLPMSLSGTSLSGTSRSDTSRLGTPRGAPLQFNRLDRSCSEPVAPSQSDFGKTDLTSENDSTERVDSPGGPIPRPVALQIHNRYLVTENEQGVVVIDQHALHERIIYEQLREKVLSGALESQKLLVPEPVDLSSSEAAIVLEKKELLSQLGIQIEPFGGDTVLVSSYPAMLANLAPVEILRDVVDALVSEGKAPERRDLLDELLHMISCKAAIKAGDRLSPEEIDALIDQRHLAQDAHHCPHGRPTSLVFTREELDRQFKRT